MSVATARLFAWLQDADFYRAMHLIAADLLPKGGGRTWLDVGSGPGLLTRIAADKGYFARGIDRDSDMIETARRLAAERRNNAIFEVSDIEKAIREEARYDVVSASSLLVILPDPPAALRQLVSLMKPDGTLLIIEASEKMTRMRALAEVVSGRLGHRAYMLQAWAMFRSGRALPPATFDQPGLRASRFPVLKGSANAWIIERAD